MTPIILAISPVLIIIIWIVIVVLISYLGYRVGWAIYKRMNKNDKDKK
jgi:hypothetical protein